MDSNENIEPLVGERETRPQGKPPAFPSTFSSLSNSARIGLVIALLVLIGIGLFAA